MKRLLLVAGLLVQLVLSQSVSATTFTFGDTSKVWPGWGTATENGADVIGEPHISGGSLDVINGELTRVTIDATGLLSYPQFVSGDLFINLVSGAGDTSWDYIVKSLDVRNQTNVNVFDVRNLNITTASPGATNSYVMSSWPTNSNIRDNQPVGISFGTTPPVIGSAQFSGLTGSGVTYNFTNPLLSPTNGFLDGLSADGVGSILLGWTVNCGNDVLYQNTPVPEPGTMVLCGFGLLGLVVYGKRRMSKSA